MPDPIRFGGQLVMRTLANKYVPSHPFSIRKTQRGVVEESFHNPLPASALVCTEWAPCERPAFGRCLRLPYSACISPAVSMALSRAASPAGGLAGTSEWALGICGREGPLRHHSLGCTGGQGPPGPAPQYHWEVAALWVHLTSIGAVPPCAQLSRSLDLNQVIRGCGSAAELGREGGRAFCWL